MRGPVEYAQEHSHGVLQRDQPGELCGQVEALDAEQQVVEAVVDENDVDEVLIHQPGTEGRGIAVHIHARL